MTKEIWASMAQFENAREKKSIADSERVHTKNKKNKDEISIRLTNKRDIIRLPLELFKKIQNKEAKSQTTPK